MKKKILAVLLAVSMVSVMFAGCGGDDKTSDAGNDTKQTEDSSKDDTEEYTGEFNLDELDYEPKEGYDKFTVTEFTVEDLGQTLEIVVSATKDNKSFNLRMEFFGGDADIDVKVLGDGEYEVTNDSGFFQTEGPLVVEQVLEENNWAPIE